MWLWALYDIYHKRIVHQARIRFNSHRPAFGFYLLPTAYLLVGKKAGGGRLRDAFHWRHLKLNNSLICELFVRNQIHFYDYSGFFLYGSRMTQSILIYTWPLWWWKLAISNCGEEMVGKYRWRLTHESEAGPGRSCSEMWRAERGMDDVFLTLTHWPWCFEQAENYGRDVCKTIHFRTTKEVERKTRG